MLFRFCSRFASLRQKSENPIIKNLDIYITDRYMYTHQKIISQNEPLIIPDIIAKTKMNHMVQKKSYTNLKSREGKYYPVLEHSFLPERYIYIFLKMIFI